MTAIDFPYKFNRNDPYDRSRPIQLVVERLLSSRDYMRSMRDFEVPEEGLAVWFLGQNGFVLKAAGGKLIAIDPYLTNHIADKYPDLAFRVDRQLPVFVEPEDFDVDVILFTHSHSDHTDMETLRRLGGKESKRFVGPYESCVRFRKCDLPESNILLIHPNQTLDLGGVSVSGVFALPTDATDLNHMGFVLEFPNGIRFYNSGDTAYCDLLSHVRDYEVDICTICINGGFHNLSHFDAAKIVQMIKPRVVIPCHYDMMVNNVGDPLMFRASLDVLGVDVECRLLRYYEPWVYLPA